MRRNDLIEMFLDGQAGEVYADGRLRTVETENGLALVAYHNEVLARLNQEADSIELYTGHYGQVSQTVTRYIHELGKLLNRREGFDVTVLGGHAPTTGYGRASEAAQFISQYIGSFGDMSGAEERAFEKVQNALIRELEADDE
jgi:pyridoxine 5'-phosphate synthase PdxJ